jgi:hypothetical protein
MGPRVARPDDRLRGVSNHVAPPVPYILRDGASRLLRMRPDTYRIRSGTIKTGS